MILLGASNLTLSFSTVVETVRLLWDEPVEIMAAMGLGRSFGQDSSVCGRKIPGIFPCALWQNLLRRPPLPTAALVTDIGNDLLYGVPVERLLEWIEGCLDRLGEAGAATIMTGLPMDSVERLGEARFRLFRTLLFPSSRITLSEAKSLVGTLHERLTKLSEARKTPVISVSSDWYGFDPIHLKRSVWRSAWPTILSPWRDGTAHCVAPRGSAWRWSYLMSLAPAERTIWGVRRRSEQPCGILKDGTTISLY